MCAVRRPRFLQRGLHARRGRSQIRDEFTVASASAIVGLLAGEEKKFAYQREVEVQKKSAVEEQEAFPPTLRVAGELQTVEREVGVALNAECGVRSAECGVNCRAIALHDETVRRAAAAGRQIGS